jgi:hypothetical protein
MSLSMIPYVRDTSFPTTCCKRARTSLRRKTHDTGTIRITSPSRHLDDTSNRQTGLVIAVCTIFQPAADQIMPSNDASDRKRKPTSIPDTVSSSDNNKARRVSTANAWHPSASTAASLQIDTAVARPEDSYESIGQMIQDLSHSDIVQVNAALDALNLDLKDDKKKCTKIQVVGGCLALVQLLKKCLDKAIDEFPARDQVIDLNELAELATLHKTLHILIRLTHHLDESKVGIAAIGGVEAVIKAMKTFPKCQALQEFACILVHNLACCSIGKKRIVDADEMEVFLAAINNHLNSAILCNYACIALCNITEKESKENTGLLISLGGATAVAKVRSKWRNNDLILTRVRKLANLIASEMKTWADEE